MLDAVETTYLVADSTKFSKTDFACLGTLSLIDFIITDPEIEKKDKKLFRENGINIIRCVNYYQSGLQ